MKTQTFSTMPEFVRQYLFDICERAVLGVCKSLRQHADSKDIILLQSITAEIMHIHDLTGRNEMRAFDDCMYDGKGFDLCIAAYDHLAQILPENALDLFSSFGLRSVLFTVHDCFVENRRTALQAMRVAKKSFYGRIQSYVRAEISKQGGFDFRRQKCTYIENPDSTLFTEYIEMRYTRNEDIAHERAIIESLASFRETLTDRQDKILDYLLFGYRAKIIAQILHCSHQAVTKHIRAIQERALQYFCISQEDAMHLRIETESNEDLSIMDNFGKFLNDCFKENAQIYVSENVPTHEVKPENGEIRLSAAISAFSTKNECIVESLKYRYSNKLSMLQYWKHA